MFTVQRKVAQICHVPICHLSVSDAFQSNFGLNRHIAFHPTFTIQSSSLFHLIMILSTQIVLLCVRSHLNYT